MFGLMRLYFLAQMQLAPNQDLVDEIKRMTRRPSFLLGRGVDIDALSPEKRTRDSGDKELVLGFVGRLRPEKNVRALGRLDAALQAAGVTGYKFLIVGDGDERQWLEKNLSKAEFTGEIRGTAVAEAFANMDLFVFPSLTDAFGNVVLEAMASGVPAIAFPVGGPKFLIEDGISGYLEDTEGEMAAKVAEIFKDRDVLLSMKSAARAFAVEHSWNAIFKKTYEYYLDCSGYKKNVRATTAKAGSRKI
jgi:glycosyltransferase involved in cell wall biosynthesis